MHQVILVLLMMIILVPEAWAQKRVPSLQGSPTTVNRVYEVAMDHDFTFMATAKEVNRFVAMGLLVYLPGNANYGIDDVSFPLVRPETRLFVERISAQYKSACGDKLMVTSATRPTNLQPSNASGKSVHPTGMSIDLRIPGNRKCREWLERTALTLEGRGVLDITREKNPPHYHVPVFPKEYAAYVKARTNNTATAINYRVRSGDTLSGIARSHNTTVAKIMATNGMRSSVIRQGATLKIPR